MQLKRFLGMKVCMGYKPQIDIAQIFPCAYSFDRRDNLRHIVLRCTKWRKQPEINKCCPVWQVPSAEMGAWQGYRSGKSSVNALRTTHKESVSVRLLPGWPWNVLMSEGPLWPGPDIIYTCLSFINKVILTWCPCHSFINKLFMSSALFNTSNFVCCLVPLLSINI